MDKFTRQMLEQTGLLGMVGKSERGQIAIDAIQDNRAVYLMAVGGAAYLVSKAIKAARVVGFADLGMEAIYEFTVEDMPVTVAVDSEGNNVHQLAPHPVELALQLLHHAHQLRPLPQRPLQLTLETVHPPPQRLPLVPRLLPQLRRIARVDPPRPQPPARHEPQPRRRQRRQPPQHVRVNHAAPS